jgi:hypothetical protein
VTLLPWQYPVVRRALQRGTGTAGRFDWRRLHEDTLVCPVLQNHVLYWAGPSNNVYASLKIQQEDGATCSDTM